jgi:AcrR family transcriptional regulator
MGVRRQGRRGSQPASAARRPTQVERAAAMRGRLTRAAIESLIERGYTRTTAVEVCARVGVSRGAFHHHFSGLAALYGAALRALYAELTEDASVALPAKPVAPAALVEGMWHKTRRREFKAIIEIWLAARNDPTLGTELRPLIKKLSALFSPAQNPRLARRLGSSARTLAFYRLAMEAMIGMALGRAVSPDGDPVAHEEAVVRLLKSLAADL